MFFWISISFSASYWEDEFDDPLERLNVVATFKLDVPWLDQGSCFARLDICWLFDQDSCFIWPAIPWLYWGSFFAPWDVCWLEWGSSFILPDIPKLDCGFVKSKSVAGFPLIFCSSDYLPSCQSSLELSYLITIISKSLYLHTQRNYLCSFSNIIHV